MNDQNHCLDPEVAHACVIQLGFSGSRDLFPGISDPLRRARLTQALTAQVAQKLSELRNRPELHLHEGHVLVGIAQMAVGGDWAFADACEQAGILLRVFLPQPRDEFLAGKEARPPFADDFTPAQREQATQRLQRAGVVQQRVVSMASERTARFVETDVEILRAADIAVILQPKHADGLGKPGSTNEFAEQALRGGKPLYALTFWIDENQQLHVYDELRYPRDRHWPAPRLPAVVPEPALGLDELAPRVAAECSALAQQSRAQCERDSARRVLLHIGLMLLVSTVLLLIHLFGDRVDQNLAWLVSLVAGLLVVPAAILVWRAFSMKAPASAMHRQRWTDLHLAAELARSALALSPVAADGADGRVASAGQPHDLAFLLRPTLPSEHRALAQALAIAHLRRMRTEKPVPWEESRDRYVRERLEQPATGQLAFYRERLEQIRCHVRAVSIQAGLLGGFATLVVLAVLLLPVPALALAAALSRLALLLILVALVLQAQRCVLKHRLRVSAGSELLKQLESLAQRLQRAPSECEFLVLQNETESLLLAATLDWYRWRRNDD